MLVTQLALPSIGITVSLAGQDDEWNERLLSYARRQLDALQRLASDDEARAQARQLKERCEREAADRRRLESEMGELARVRAELQARVQELEAALAQAGMDSRRRGSGSDTLETDKVEFRVSDWDERAGEKMVEVYESVQHTRVEEHVHYDTHTEAAADGSLSLGHDIDAAADEVHHRPCAAELSSGSALLPLPPPVTSMRPNDAVVAVRDAHPQLRPMKAPGPAYRRMSRPMEEKAHVLEPPGTVAAAAAAHTEAMSVAKCRVNPVKSTATQTAAVTDADPSAALEPCDNQPLLPPPPLEALAAAKVKLTESEKEARARAGRSRLDEAVRTELERLRGMTQARAEAYAKLDAFVRFYVPVLHVQVNEQALGLRYTAWVGMSLHYTGVLSSAIGR